MLYINVASSQSPILIVIKGGTVCSRSYFYDKYFTREARGGRKGAHFTCKKMTVYFPHLILNSAVKSFTAAAFYIYTVHSGHKF